MDSSDQPTTGHTPAPGRREDAAARTTVELTGAQLKTLAHPLRMRLLASLRSEGPSTASRLATRLGSNSGKTSYHLRQLAQAGLVDEATDLGDDRDRWWRAAHDQTSWVSSVAADPETRSANDWMMAFIARAHAAQTNGWIEDRLDVDEAWDAAATLSDWGVRLRPEALASLVTEIAELVDRYIAAEDPADRQAEQCAVILHAFPNPEPRL